MEMIAERLEDINPSTKYLCGTETPSKLIAFAFLRALDKQTIPSCEINKSLNSSGTNIFNDSPIRYDSALIAIGFNHRARNRAPRTRARRLRDKKPDELRSTTKRFPFSNFLSQLLIRTIVFLPGWKGSSPAWHCAEAACFQP